MEAPPTGNVVPGEVCVSCIYAVRPGFIQAQDNEGNNVNRSIVLVQYTGNETRKEFATRNQSARGRQVHRDGILDIGQAQARGMRQDRASLLLLQGEVHAGTRHAGTGHVQRRELLHGQ